MFLLNSNEEKFSMKKILKQSLLIWLLYLGCFIISGLANPKVFPKYFSTDTNPGFGDITYYTGIALNGYDNHPREKNAYYPLWPLVQKVISLPAPQRIELFSSLTALLLFMISIPFLLSGFGRVFGSRAAFISVLLYALNPMSLFHAIGYTESLFCLLMVPFILSLLSLDEKPSLRHWIILFFSGVLLALTRPVSVQLI